MPDNTIAASCGVSPLVPEFPAVSAIDDDKPLAAGVEVEDESPSLPELPDRSYWRPDVPHRLVLPPGVDAQAVFRQFQERRRAEGRTGSWDKPAEPAVPPKSVTATAPSKDAAKAKPPAKTEATVPDSKASPTDARLMKYKSDLRFACECEAIDAIKPGWSVSEFEKNINDFIQIMGMNVSLTDTTIYDILGSFRKRLTACGYEPLPMGKYVKMVRAEMRYQREISAGASATTRARVAKEAGQIVRPFVARTNGDPSVSAIDPDKWGIYRLKGQLPDAQLCNFTMSIDRDVQVDDDLDPQRRFEGRIGLHGKESPFAITAKDFGNSEKLQAAIFAAAGPKAQILCPLSQLRTAVSSLSEPQRGRVTTNFGWNEQLEYLVPGGRITADGFNAAGEGDGLRVDLTAEERARQLDLRPLAADELVRVKRHVVEDLLALHDRRVTYSLLGTAALAVLYRHVGGAGRYALWLKGLTGSGKSFAAKLFMNFFGSFPVSSGHFVTWSATANYIQRQGYFFRDALYLVDDYKPEVIRPEQAIRVLQTYADATSRGRLRCDATTNVSREIRGLLVSTGEDMPEHTASALARSIVIDVPQRTKDLQRGYRCVQESCHYSGVTADFIRHLIAEKRLDGFAGRVAERQQYFYDGIAGQQNDARIASNFALLAAGFEEIAAYLADVWPNAAEEAKRFVEQDLVAIRDEMLGQVREQQASEVFLSMLAALIEQRQVLVRNWRGCDENEAVVGRFVGMSSPQTFELSAPLCLEAVNQSLQRQCRPPLKTTLKALLGQLAADGKVLPQPVQAGVRGEMAVTSQCWLNGKNMRVFRIACDTLLGCQPALTSRRVHT